MAGPTPWWQRSSISSQEDEQSRSHKSISELVHRDFSHKPAYERVYRDINVAVGKAEQRQPRQESRRGKNLHHVGRVTEKHVSDRSSIRGLSPAGANAVAAFLEASSASEGEGRTSSDDGEQLARRERSSERSSAGSSSHRKFVVRERSTERSPSHPGYNQRDAPHQRSSPHHRQPEYHSTQARTTSTYSEHSALPRHSGTSPSTAPSVHKSSSRSQEPYQHPPRQPPIGHPEAPNGANNNLSWRLAPEESFSDWKIKVLRKDSGRQDVYHVSETKKMACFSFTLSTDVLTTKFIHFFLSLSCRFIE
jgi:hypothetical protein